MCPPCRRIRWNAFASALRTLPIFPDWSVPPPPHPLAQLIFLSLSDQSLFVSLLEQCFGPSLLTDHPARDAFLRAKALSLFHQRHFVELYSFIRHNQFAPRDHPLLQRLWNEAHYAEVMGDLIGGEIERDDQQR